MTMLNPNLLFIMALKHIIHTWISSDSTPTRFFNFLLDCLILSTLDPTKSAFSPVLLLIVILPKMDFFDNVEPLALWPEKKEKSV